MSDCYLYGSTEYYKKLNVANVKIKGNPASNDTWIIHSNNCLSDREIRLFNFELGKQGCDNKIIYLFKILGYEIYNDVDFIKTYHYHIGFSKIREYSCTGYEMPPWGLYFPSCVDLSNTYLKILDIDLTLTFEEKSQSFSSHSKIVP